MDEEVRVDDLERRCRNLERIVMQLGINCTEYNTNGSARKDIDAFCGSVKVTARDFPFIEMPK